MKCPEIIRILDNIKHKKYQNNLNIDNILDKKNRDERCIEIPYALSKYTGQKDILEIGLSLADIDLVESQILLQKYSEANLSACDIVDIKRVNNRFLSLNENIISKYNFLQSDIRNTSYEDNTFDFIFLISTLEHVGFDEFEPNQNLDTVFVRNESFPKELPEYESCNQDVIVMHELKRILKKNGSLIITVPFGNRGVCLLKDSKNLYSMYKEYSLGAWNKLIFNSNLELIDNKFYSNDKSEGWINLEDIDKISDNQDSIDAIVKNVICSEFKKN